MDGKLFARVSVYTSRLFGWSSVAGYSLSFFRWGHRRGRGRFAATFGIQQVKPTIESVAGKLSEDSRIVNFKSSIGQALLGDMLLTSTLENRRRDEGHKEQVQRCFASHYMASWIDLPFDAANLRGVPEAIVALIADQKTGASILAGSVGRYPVSARVQDNEFVAAFAPGVRVEVDYRRQTNSDRFDDTTEVGLDQLLTIRLAQLCGEAPGKAFGKGDPGPIPNQQSIATRAARHFREDLLTFFDCYGKNGVVPRLSLLSMLESAMSVGLTSVFMSTISIIDHWVSHAVVPGFDTQNAWPLFIDASGSADPALRDLSEHSGDLARQQVSRVSTTLMYMRLLEWFVSKEADASPDLPTGTPDGTALLNYLGAFASGIHKESSDAEKFFRGKCRALAEAFSEFASKRSANRHIEERE